MTFAKKLYLLITVALCGLIALGALSLIQIQSVYQAASYASTNSLPSIEHLDDAAAAMFRMRIAVWKHITSTDAADKKQDLDDIQGYQREITGLLARYEQENISDEQDRALLEQDRKTLAAYYAVRDAVLAFSSAGDFDAARRRQLAIQEEIKHADSALQRHRAYNVTLAHAAAARADATRLNAAWMSTAIGVLITVAVAAAGVLLVWCAS